MKTLTFFSQIGGSGKTTLAVHTAVAAEAAGAGVVILDLDPQGSAQAWAGVREAQTPPVKACRIAELAGWLDQARQLDASLAVLDAPPHVSDVAPRFIAVADLVVIPVRPTVLDLAALPQAVRLVQAAKAKAVFVLSAAKPRVSETDEVRQALVDGYGYPVARTVIHDRAAFSRALATGRAVTEFEPKGQAALEISALYKELRGMTQ